MVTPAPGTRDASGSSKPHTTASEQTGGHTETSPHPRPCSVPLPTWTRASGRNADLRARERLRTRLSGCDRRNRRNHRGWVRREARWVTHETYKEVSCKLAGSRQETGNKQEADRRQEQTGERNKQQTGSRRDRNRKDTGSRQEADS